MFSSFVSELFFGEVFETFAVLSAIILPIKLEVASAVCWTTLFGPVSNAFVEDCLALSRSFCSWIKN